MIKSYQCSSCKKNYHSKAYLQQHKRICKYDPSSKKFFGFLVVKNEKKTCAPESLEIQLANESNIEEISISKSQFYSETDVDLNLQNHELSSKSSPVLIPVSSSMPVEFPPSLVENPAGETGIIPLISQNWTPNVISFQNVQQANEAEQFLLRMKEMELYNLLSLLNSYNYGNLLTAAHFQSPLPPDIMNPLYTHHPNEMLLLSSLLMNPCISSSQIPTDNSNQRLLEWIAIMESLRASNH